MKVHLRTLGCRLNQAEIDALGRALVAGGHQLVSDPAEAEQVLLNTCAVTQDAVHTSRKLARQLHRAAPAAGITLTGCYAQLAPEEASLLPGVGQVVGNAGKDGLTRAMGGLEPYDVEPLLRQPPNAAGRTRAFVKVQDGCDNACTFCVTTLARGAGRSRPADEVVREIRLLVGLGYYEAVLTGVHLGSYGQDRGQPNALSDLIQRILGETAIARLRLSSLEPWDLSPALFELWRDTRLCPHLHLPLQSGCDATLRRMNRRTTQTQFRRLVEAARDQLDDPAITTDLIVGFPGETDAEFAETTAYVEQLQFADLHIFRYSQRPGTPAARMRNPVGESVKRRRSETLHLLAAEARAGYASRWIGRSEPVLWEQVAGACEEGFINVGYTPRYLRATCVHRLALTQQITPARLDMFDRATGQIHVTPQIDPIETEVNDG